MSSQPLRPDRETARGVFTCRYVKTSGRNQGGLSCVPSVPCVPSVCRGCSGCPGIVPVRSLPLPTVSALCAAHSCLSAAACARPWPRVLLL